MTVQLDRAARRLRTAAGWSVPLALAALLASGCTHAAAKTSPDLPPLDVPAPPPRDIEPVDAEAPQPVPLPEEPARRAPARARPQPRASEPPKPEPPKPEPPPAPQAETPRPPDDAAKASPLTTTPPASEGELEKSIRATLARASNDLHRVDVRTLNPDARSQYDYARRFINQAEDALNKKNLVFAKSVADKAAGLAAQLAGK
jgi:hypothetical protein